MSKIASYLSERSPASMQRVRTTIPDALRTRLLFPRIGRHQSVEGVRKLGTRQYGYLIYYLVDDDHDELVVVGVKHPARARDTTNE